MILLLIPAEEPFAGMRIHHRAAKNGAGFRGTADGVNAFLAGHRGKRAEVAVERHHAVRDMHRGDANPHVIRRAADRAHIVEVVMPEMLIAIADLNGAHSAGRENAKMLPVQRVLADDMS